jgi:hypothetical protein
VVCDVPGCTDDTKGRVAVFAEGWDGGLTVSLCIAHLFNIVAMWPSILQVFAGGKAPDGG